MHREIELVRVAYRSNGTFGVLLDRGDKDNGLDLDGDPFAVTCEEVWRNNAKGISCIPPGRYLCKRVISPKFGETFEIVDVPGRSSILFHWGNTILDTEGCVLVAEEFGRLSGMTAVAVSRSEGKGFNEFMQRLVGVDAFWLTVSEFRIPQPLSL